MELANIPDKVPTPITRISTTASNVIVGPIMAMPRAIFSATSSWKIYKGVGIH